MKYIYFPDLKVLFEEFCDKVKTKGMEYIESKEFKKSEYNNYTAIDLLEAIKNEEHEDRRAVLLCLLSYKLSRVKKNSLKLYSSQEERQHYQNFMKGFNA